MDHTLVRYKLKNFVPHVVEATCVYLVNLKGYPQDIFPHDDEDTQRMYPFFFRAIFDHKTGYMLKIGCSMTIMRAYFGFDELPSEEIIAVYGNPPVLPDFTVYSFKHSDFTHMHEFFGAAISPLVIRMVDMKKRGNSFFSKKSYTEMINDIWAANTHNYGINDFHIFDTRKYTGNFFPKFLSQTRRYVNDVNKEFLNRLMELKKRGTLTFIVSNSYYHIGNIILKSAIGEDWHKYFSFVIFDAKKPSFFDIHLKNPPPLIDLDQKVVNFEEVLRSKSEDKKKKIFLNGHFLQIHKYLFNNVSKNFMAAFCGDTIASDCVLEGEKLFTKWWDTIYILEELQEIENGMPLDEYFNTATVWGSALHDRNISVGGIEKTTVFEFADLIASRSFSRLDSEDCLDFFQI